MTHTAPAPGSHSARILSALQWLKTESRETRYARICAARCAGASGWNRLNLLRGNFDKGEPIRRLRASFRQREAAARAREQAS